MGKILKNLHWIIIAIAIFNFYAVYVESEEKLANLEGQQEVQRNNLTRNKKIQKDIANYYKNIKEEKDKIERVAKEIEKTQQLLPSDLSDSENITLLRRMADDINIKEVGVTPGAETDKGFFYARKYVVTAKATYLQFLILFEKISENKRILNIGEASFKKAAQPQRGKFQVIDGEFTIEAYRYNTNYKENRGIDEIEKQFEAGKKKSPAPRAKPSKEIDV